MNADDFEQELQRQPLRPLPSAWRKDILAAAREAATMPQRGTASPLSCWRVVFARFPVAWGALAVVWTVLIAANFLASDTSVPVSGLQVTASPPEPSTVWRLQDVVLRQLESSEDSFTELHDEVAPSQPFVRPRGESRRQDELGESLSADSSFPIV